MTYTSNFGVVPFQSTTLGLVDVPDMTKFAAIPAEFRDARYTLQYTIKDGERLDQLAKRIYDKEERYWIIMLMNDMTSLGQVWPLNEDELRESMKRRYPFNEWDDVHHYETLEGNIVDPYSEAALSGVSVSTWLSLNNPVAVSIGDYETQINDAKRNILILDPSLVDRLETAMNDAFKDSTT
jgi:hypothetical protein